MRTRTEVAAAPKLYEPDDDPPSAEPPDDAPSEKKPTRLKPPGEMVVLKDRLLYLLQPPLEALFAGGKISLPFPPYPYQVKGVAFLMPRKARPHDGAV